MESVIGALLLATLGASLAYLLIGFVIVPLYKLYRQNERLK